MATAVDGSMQLGFNRMDLIMTRISPFQIVDMVIALITINVIYLWQSIWIRKKSLRN